MYKNACAPYCFCAVLLRCSVFYPALLLFAIIPTKQRSFADFGHLQAIYVSRYIYFSLSFADCGTCPRFLLFRLSLLCRLWRHICCLLQLVCVWAFSASLQQACGFQFWKVRFYSSSMHAVLFWTVIFMCMFAAY